MQVPVNSEHLQGKGNAMTEIQVPQKSSNKLNCALLILILNWNVVGSYFGLVWATGPQAR
jgi:hypothetical protein